MAPHHQHPEPEENASSQVRGIINRLNDEKPSHEKSRELVVRPDGTKVYRVTKKRRVLITEQEKRRSGRMVFLKILMGLALIVLVLLGILSYRMSTMNGKNYIQSRISEFQQHWGAESITITGAGINGTSLNLSTLVAEFPEDSLIRRIELTDISAELDTLSFFSEILRGNELSIARANVYLNPDARHLHLPHASGKALWSFRRMKCDDLNLSVGSPENAPVHVKNAPAYLYYPRPGNTNNASIILNGGTLHLRGMRTLYIAEAKLLLSEQVISDFYVKGSTTVNTNLPEQERDRMLIRGHLDEGAALAGPFEFDSDNMPISSFTDGRLEGIFSAKTVAQAVSNNRSQARILLPLDVNEPEFTGEFRLKDICLTGFPAQSRLLEHINSSKRSNYQPARITRGWVRLQRDGGTLILEIPEEALVERDLISLRGHIELNERNELSGQMDYGMPTILTHAEYADGKSDPIFREDAGLAWLCTTISGTTHLPQDNSAELEAAAQAARGERAERLSLEDVDLNQISEGLRRQKELLQQIDKTESISDPKQEDPFAPQEDPFKHPLD
ncbi:MAG: hypothetical protein ACI4P8_03190 [Akkermansia sp.]